MTRCAPLVALLAFISIIGISPGSASAGPPAQLGFDPATPTVTAGAFQEFKLLVLDDVGARTPTTQERTINLFAGAGSFYTSANLGSLTSSVTISLGADSVIFYYRSTLASGGSPHVLNALSADALTPFLGGTGFVNVTPDVVSPSVSTITADSPVPADGTSGGVTVTSKDQYGNPRAGDTVDLSAGGGTIVTDPPGPTNSSGVASGTVSNTTAGNVVISAVVGVTPLSNTANVLFTAGGPSASTSTVTATPSVVANGVSAATVTITVKDANNNPVQGQTVTLAINPPGNGAVIGQPGGVTNASGVITGTLTSTKTGDRVVTATVGGSVIVTQTATVAFTPGPIASFDVIVDGASTAGVYDPFTLTARDAQGNVKTDYAGSVNLSATSADTRVDWGALFATNSPSNGAGNAGTFLFDTADNGTVTLSARNLFAETYRINVADGGATGQSGDLVNTPASASQIDIIEGSGQIATVATNVTTKPKVLVRDAYDNPVFGATVTFGPRTATSTVEVTSGGAPDDSTGTTGGNGELDCDVWTLGQTAGANTLRAYLGAGTPFVDFGATGQAGAGASLVISPNGAQNVTVNASPVVTLTLRDQYNNLVSGERVDVFISDALDGSLAANPGSATNSLGAGARWGNTNGSGQISVLYQAPGSAALSDVIDGSTSQVAAGSVTDLVYTTTASGGTNLRITFVGPSTVTAGTTFQFLVEAVDGGGNVDTGKNDTITLTPEGGSNLQFSLSDFGATVTQVTLSSGTATVYGQGTKAGAWDIQVSGGGLTSDTDQVTIQDTGVVDHYAVTTVDSVVAGVSFNVAIQARDVYDNLVDGASNTVDLAAVQAASPALATDVLSVTQTTLVSGQANLGEQYTFAETIRVRARDGGSKEGFSAPVKVKPAAADRIFFVSGNGATVVAGTNQALTVVVRDQFNNAVAGESVSFAPTAGGGSIPSPVLTGADGQASSTLTTGTTVATNTVAATILGGNPPDERVDFTVQTIAGPIASYAVTPTTTTVLAGASLGVTVTAKDAYNNTRVLDSSTIVALSSDGDMQFTAASGALTAGVFSTTMFDQTAENVVVTAQTQGGGPSGSTPTITVNPAGASEIVKISGDAAELAVSARQPLVVEVHDPFGNPVLAGTSITFQVTSSPGPAQFRDAVGDTTDGITTTNASGRGTVELLTASTAGTHTVKATILDGNPPATETKTFTVSTVASGIAYYTIELGATQAAAGVPVNVTVRAFDSLDNPVVSDNTTQVDLSLATGAGTPVFGADPGTLTSGVLNTTVTLTSAEIVTVRAQTLGSPGINGVSPTLTIVPGPPSGTITGNATPPTITATGLTTSLITSGVVRDQFANPVAEGEMITVAETNGRVTFDSDDQDGVTPGRQRRVGAGGTFNVVVRSKTSAGPESITFASVNGSATGAVALTLAPAPTFATTSPPSPSVVYVGETVQFSVGVTNTSTTAVTLNPATNFTFSDGTHVYSASLVTPTPIAGSATASLTFASAAVSLNQAPTYYAPTVNLIGADQYGASFSKSSTLPAQSLLVSALQITAISAPPTASRGTTDTVTVTINNPTTSDVTITSVLPRFSGAGSFTPQPGLGLPRVLAQTSGAVIKVPVFIGPGTPTGPYTINATVTGDIGGNSVVDDDVAPFSTASWTIQAGASLEYVDASVMPASVSQGQTHAFSVQIRNSGQATVTLNASTTKFVFSGPGGTYTAALNSAAAIAGMMTQTVTFAAAAVPFMTAGAYPAEIQIDGMENGVPFVDTLSTADQGDQVTVQVPAFLREPLNALSPNQVSINQAVSFVVSLVDTGDADIVLNPAATTLTFDAFTAQLSPSGNTVLQGNATTDLTFVSTVVNPSIGTGVYNPTLAISGTENGLPFFESGTMVDAVTVQAAPTIAITGIVATPSTITADQSPITVEMTVTNNGGAAVDFTQASIDFELGGVNKNGQFSIPSPPTQFQGGTTLAGGATDVVVFTVLDNGANTMSTGLMTIVGEIEVLDQNTSLPVYSDPILSSKGSLLVQSAASVQLLSYLPSQTKVTAGMNKSFPVDVVVRNNGQAGAQLDLTNPATFLNVTPPAGWSISVAPVLKKAGTDVLAGGETDTIAFTVVNSGTNIGPASVALTVAATDINSGGDRSLVSVPVAPFTVQDLGSLVVQSVALSRVLQTNGRSVPWQIVVDVTNAGQADIDVDLPGGVVITFGNAATPPVATVPLAFTGGGTVLTAGQMGEIVIAVAGTGIYPTLGAKQIGVNVSGIELNSDEQRQNSNSAPATIQGVPDLTYVSLMPDTVSKGANVQFQVEVTNTTSQGATAVLNMATTQFRFDGGVFAATLSGPYQIDGGGTETLIFNSAEIPSGAPLGAQGDMELDLHWTENGTSDQKLINTIPADDLIVQDAPDLNIVEIRPGRSEVTRGVQPTWPIVMEVINNGATAVDIDLAAAATKLTLNLLNGGANVTGQYTILQPTGLSTAGGTVLAGGASDELVFTVTGTGTSIGVVIVSGRVVGENVLTQTVVSDDTFDGGSGSFTVQLPAQLQVVEINPGRATATVGQTAPYDIEMVVQNTGGAAADLFLTEPVSALQYTGSANWDDVLQTQLAEGGTTLLGGQTGTLVFTVNTTGDTPGTTTIDGIVRGVENNTSTVLSDSTDDGGSGQIELLTASNVQVLSVVPSRASVTQNTTVDWNLTVTIENTGGSAVRFDLPTGVSVDIQDEDGGVPMAYGNVNGLEEGGTTLNGGATGTIVIPVTFTGTFTPVGPDKAVNVSIGYVDLNSDQPGTAVGASTITVQNPPALQYVPLSLDPKVASTNSLVRFRIEVSNGDVNSATATLNRATTRLYFDTGVTAYSAFLDIPSDDMIVGGATDTLIFEAKLLTSASGPYDVNVNLAWDANGAAGTTPFVIADELVVDVAPQLQIVSIVESQQRVTAGMTKEWTATMTVTNNGPSAIDLYLSNPDSTNVTFVKPGVPGNLAGYTVVQPTEIFGLGTNRLDMGQSGELVFRVTQTGPVTGDITINGYVSGDDTGSEDVIKDDTFDSGAGLVVVQSPPALTITEIRTSRPSVTAGQTTDWTTVMRVSNTGQAGARVFLDARSDIAFQAGSGAWTVGVPTLGGGGFEIEGGTADSLLFTVDQTGGNAGTWRIDGAIRGEDVNSDAAVFDSTDTSGFGSIIVQTPPQLRMTATTIPVTPATPNAPEVNTGQPFGVAVSVTNDGQATANNVSFSMTRSGGSTIGTLPAPLASVPAGATLVYTVPVTAAGAVQSDTLTASFVSAVDANTGQAVNTAPFVRNDSTAVATIVAPAGLNVVSVTPSQATVTRGQSANWTLAVVVTNTGTADMVLDAPQAGDVAFSKGGLPSSGYAVIPPTQFGSGAAGWMLAGGATDSLVYTVDDTGNDVGTIDINVTMGFTDANNPAATGSDSGQGSVNVQNPAGLSIVQTISSGTHNVSGSTAIVNTGWDYQINVTVQNSGEAVDSVSVDLGTDGSSSISRVGPQYRSIEVSQQGVFTFDVTADGPNTLEEFTSVITYAISRNTGERVTPGSATDAIQLVRTETRADLVVSYFAITSPPGAVDDSVSTGQDFVVTARVENQGAAQVTGTRELSLTPPPNFILPGADGVKAFTLGNDVTWNVRAPGAPQSAADMKVKISTLPTDRNNNMTALSSLDSALIAVTVLSGGELEDNGTAIVSPTGAVDGVLSTQQTFTIRARVIASINARDVIATLSVPGGFTAVGNTARLLGNGTGSELNTDFDVIAPVGAVASATITVTFSGTDINTSDDLTPLPLDIPVQVVPRTRLTLSASVTEPPDARDRTVTIGTPFTVQATVANVANAADIDGPAFLTITVPTGAGYSLQGGEQATKPFTVGNPVTWVVVAAPQPSGPDDVVITISTVPDDENSNQTALVTDGQETIAMVTEGSAISVTDVTEAQGIHNAVVPSGAADIDVLAFEMKYTATDQDAAKARIDTIAVTILGANGQPLGAGAVARTLSRVYVRLGPTATYQTTTITSNPVVIAFTGPGAERIIPPGGTQTALVGVDVAGNPAVEELSVQVRGGGLIVRDDFSQQPLGVVDANTGQGLDGRLTSAPLVILGNDFEEYVHNYPNPFRAGSQVTKIAYFMNSPGAVSMKIYSISGELVYELEVPGGDARTTPGPHELEWDGRNGVNEIVRNGIYVCVLNAGGNSATFRIAVAK